MSIYSKLLTIQQGLKAPKDLNNSFGGYKYRSCESILEALKPCLKSAGCVVTLCDSIDMVADRIYIKSTATITDTETGESTSATAFAREPLNKKGMDDSQVTGAASSYARKYALNGLFAIDDNKDSDTNEYCSTTQNKRAICEDCGGVITGNGKLTAETIAGNTKAKYGAVLCMACAKKRKESVTNV